MKDAFGKCPESDYDGSYSSIYMSRNRVRSWMNNHFTIWLHKDIFLFIRLLQNEKIGVDQYEFVEKNVEDCR